MTTSSSLVVHPKDVHKFKVIFPSYDRLAIEDFRGHSNIVQPLKNQAKNEVNTTVFKVRYPSSGGMKPVIGSSIFPGSVEMFLPGPKEWTDAASTASNRNTGNWSQEACSVTEISFNNLWNPVSNFCLLQQCVNYDREHWIEDNLTS